MLRARTATLTREGRDTLWLLLALTLSLAPLTHWPLISPWVLSRLGSLRLASGVDIAVLSRGKGSRVKTKSADGCHPGGLCKYCKNMSIFGL